MRPDIKCCETCAFGGTSNEYARCTRFHTYCSVALKFRCGDSLQHWVAAQPPKPVKPPVPAKPRRSVRQWFYDVFWRIDPPTPPVPHVPNRKFDFETNQP